MTSPGQYGSHQYQSPETRALASIKADSYDKDQAKTIIKLKNDVGYMAAYMRKMQKSIDQANENFIQQIQSFIADFIVLLGGGSLTTIDFGDLRYVIQAIGALLGFQTVAGIPIPINLFTAAWNFFGIYIAPSQQFADVINELIDAGISIIIDALGDIPVFGQSIQQLAAWLIEIRDALWPLVDTVFALIDLLSGQPGSEVDDVLTGVFHQVMDMLIAAPDVLLSVLDSLINLLLETPQILLSLLNGLISMLIDSPDILTTLLDGLVNMLVQVPTILETLLTGLITLLLEVPNLLYELLDALMTLIVAAPEILVKLLVGLVELLIESPEILFNLAEALVGLVVITPEILIKLVEAVADSFGDLFGIDMSTVLDASSGLNALNLFNLVPVDLMSHIPASNIGTYITNLVSDPNFLDAASLSNIFGWVHNLTGGPSGVGAMSTTADGTLKQLMGNLIPVSEGQVMPIKGSVKWTNLVGTGSPIVLGVTGYDTANNIVDQTTVASHNTTPTTTDWTQLSGTYTVPANVSSIRTRLSVLATATAGTIGFSQISATKTQPLIQRLIAGTNPGEFLPNDITHLFTGIISNTTELVNKAGLGDFNDLVATIGGDIGDDIAAVETRLNDFLNSLSILNGSNIKTGTILDDFVPGIGHIIDTSVINVSNIGSGSGWDYKHFGSTLLSQTNSIVNAASNVTGLLARLGNLESKVSALPVASGGTGTGNADGGLIGGLDNEEFERVNSSDLGPQWLTSYSGSGGIWSTANGHDAMFSPSGASNREFLCIRNNPEIPRSQTDYQRVTQTLMTGSTRFYDSILGLYNYTGHNDIWLRVSDNTTSILDVTGIRVRFGGDGSASICRFISGALSATLASKPPGSFVIPGPGAQMIGEAGNLINGAPRFFRGIIGTAIRIEIQEPGTASGLGSQFRRWGHGGRAEGFTVFPLGTGQAYPGGLHRWVGADQTQ